MKTKDGRETDKRDEKTEAKKEYLRQYLPKLTAVKDLEEEMERIRLEKLHPSARAADGLPYSRNKKDLSDYMAALGRVQEKMIRARYQKIMCYEEIFQKIESMEDETEKRVLRLKYIRGKSWEKVAEEMDYSLRAIHKIHNRALRNFEVG